MTDRQGERICMTLLFIAAALCLWLGMSGCERRELPPAPAPVNVKFCVERCMRHQFEWFHGEGQSWGTGSSSMNGLGQKQIYDTVEKRCRDFYAGVKCCPGDGRRGWDNINTVHSYEFGECR